MLTKEHLRFDKKVEASWKQHDISDKTMHSVLNKLSKSYNRPIEAWWGAVGTCVGSRLTASHSAQERITFQMREISMRSTDTAKPALTVYTDLWLCASSLWCWKIYSHHCHTKPEETTIYPHLSPHKNLTEKHFFNKVIF